MKEKDSIGISLKERMERRFIINPIRVVVNVPQYMQKIVNFFKMYLK